LGIVFVVKVDFRRCFVGLPLSACCEGIERINQSFLHFQFKVIISNVSLPSIRQLSWIDRQFSGWDSNWGRPVIEAHFSANWWALYQPRAFDTMADFKTHITTSTICGIGLGATAYIGFEYPLDQCLLAAALCSIAGMLPDLDSDNGVPVRETFAFAAAIVPMLMIERFQHMHLTAEQMALAGVFIYLGVRFGVSRIFKRFTVHRGMWHSIPAALIAALLAFLICSCPDVRVRLFKAFAVFLGFCSHLVLDEIYSIDLSGRSIRIKRSLGTAMKFWSGDFWANLSTYTKLGLLIMVIAYDETLMASLGFEPVRIPATAHDWLNGIVSQAREISAHLE
jgi:membrane-bound metal-dependent hydrolase YbcI (DUF457 family)